MARLPRTWPAQGTVYRVRRPRKIAGGHDGWHEPRSAEIYVLAGVAAEVAFETLLHEGAHADMLHSGARERVREFLRDPEDDMKVEHIIVEQFVPAFVASLRQLGLLKLPTKR